MTRIMTSLLAGTAVLGLTAVVHAADMGGPYRAPQVIPPVSEPAFGGGWYLRGDVGVGITEKNDNWREPTIDQQAPGTAGWNGRTMSDTTFVDLGVGYQFTSYLRGDITAQYRNSVTFSGNNYINSGGSYFVDHMEGRMRSVAVLANVYGDLGTYSGITPYIGAGIGAAYNILSATDTGAAASNMGAFGTYDEKGKWNFAWALHAGASYDVTRNLKLDVGYSFLNLGDAKTGNLNCYDSATNKTNYCNSGFGIEKIHSHDLHVGFRWMLDSAAPPPPAYSAPIVAKY